MWRIFNVPNSVKNCMHIHLPFIKEIEIIMTMHNDYYFNFLDKQILIRGRYMGDKARAHGQLSFGWLSP